MSVTAAARESFSFARPTMKAATSAPRLFVAKRIGPGAMILTGVTDACRIAIDPDVFDVTIADSPELRSIPKIPNTVVALRLQGDLTGLIALPPLTQDFDLFVEKAKTSRDVMMAACDRRDAKTMVFDVDLAGMDDRDLMSALVETGTPNVRMWTNHAVDKGWFDVARQIMLTDSPMLHVAAITGSIDMTRDILSLQTCNVNAKNRTGQTALHLARDPEIVRLLLEQPGVDVRVMDCMFMTPLNWSRHHADGDLVAEMLLLKALELA